jgi:hypothetical protein
MAFGGRTTLHGTSEVSAALCVLCGLKTLRDLCPRMVAGYDWLLPICGERGPVAGVEVALRRQSLGEQYRVPLEFDVPVDDPGDIFLRDRHAVDEVPSGDQNIIDINRMIRRQPKCTPRKARAERTRRDAHWPHLQRPRMAEAIDAAMADPSHRQQLPGSAHDQLALAQVFDADGTVSRHDVRARGEARRLDDERGAGGSDRG